MLQARTLRLSALGLTGGLEELVLMSSVHTLFLNDNRFCSLAGLEFLLQLKCLYCSYNQITSLAPLCALPALQVLDVRSNQLQAFENVACLPPSLRMLSLAGNPCCSLPPHPCLHLQISLPLYFQIPLPLYNQIPFPRKISSRSCPRPPPQVAVCIQIPCPSSCVSRGWQQQRSACSHTGCLLCCSGAAPPPRYLHMFKLLMLRAGEVKDRLHCRKPQGYAPRQQLCCKVQTCSLCCMLFKPSLALALLHICSASARNAKLAARRQD